MHNYSTYYGRNDIWRWTIEIDASWYKQVVEGAQSLDFFLHGIL